MTSTVDSPANAGPTSTGPVRASPVRTARLDDPLSRGLWLVKWLLVVPHLVVLGFLWIAFGVLSVVAFVAILVTGRYPRSIFEFNLELDVLADVTAALGFSPETRFSGPLQASVPDDIGEDLLAVLREALSNIARHANARSAAVEISVHDALTLRVVDDGVGMPATTRRSGLANMAARAERHGGALHVARGDRAGTTLSWTVPIR